MLHVNIFILGERSVKGESHHKLPELQNKLLTMGILFFYCSFLASLNRTNIGLVYSVQIFEFSPVDLWEAKGNLISSGKLRHL